MPIKLNGTTINNGGTCTFNGNNVTKIVWSSGGTNYTVWEAKQQYFPDGLTYSTGGAGSSMSSVTSTKLTAKCDGSSYTNANCHPSTTVNLTNISSIKFTVDNITKSGNAEVTVGVCKTQNPNNYASYASNSGKGLAVTSTGTKTLDVSDLTGTGYYICISVWGSTGGAEIGVTKIVEG